MDFLYVVHHDATLGKLDYQAHPLWRKKLPVGFHTELSIYVPWDFPTPNKSFPPPEFRALLLKHIIISVDMYTTENYCWSSWDWTKTSPG